MKITITKEFNSYEEAIKFLGAAEHADYGAPTPATNANPGAASVPADTSAVPAIPAVATAGSTPAPQAAASGAASPSAEKKPRKPRSDAGQPRGAYKTTGDAGSSPVGATSPAPQVPTPSTPSAVPVQNPSTEKVVGQAPTPAAADLTLDAIRETLGKLHKTPGKGTEACIDALKKFGVLRISDLPKEKYAEFDAYVRGQLPKGMA